jgi:hypothetical protein
VSTWRRKAQELYPPLAGQLETWERTDWNFAFSKILSNAVASEEVAALAEGVRYLQWCWSQHTADEQFVYFVETTLRHLLERPADRAAFCRVADDRTFASVLAMYSYFHEKHEVVDFEREYRFSHRPNTSFERTREG